MGDDRVAVLEETLARERARLHALQEVGAALGSTLDLNELLELVMDRVSRVMEADRSTLYLLDEDAGELWSKVAQGEEVMEIRLRVGEGIAGWVAKAGEPLNIRDAYQDLRFDSEWDQRTGYRTRTILCVPLKNQHGRTIGAIQCLNKRLGVFTAEDETLLNALAAQAAVSIENSKLFLSVVGKNMELLETKEQLERKVRELDVLFEIAQVSASAQQLEDLLEGVLARTMRAIEAQAGSILIADDVQGDLTFRAAVGGEPEAVRHVQIPVGQGICGWVAKNGKAQVVNDVERDPRHSQSISERVGYHPKTLLCVPLRWGDGVGALELLNKRGGRDVFTSDDVKLATMIAGHISTAIDLARSRDRQAREERLSSIGQFLSSVLHDLKTPMTVISGYVQLLGEEPSAEVREGYGELILKQIELINAMTHETLAFARGDRKLWVRKVYLHSFFEELVDQLRRDLEPRSITVSLELHDRGVGRFDPHKLQRAVHNLARNAAEAMAGTEGGHFVLGVSRRADDGALLLSFADNGRGIPEAIRARLFESFTTHGKTDGTGLGLAIVRRIVEDHDGQIEVQSEPGRTVFTVVLPQEQADAKGQRRAGDTAAGDDSTSGGQSAAL